MKKSIVLSLFLIALMAMMGPIQTVVAQTKGKTTSTKTTKTTTATKKKQPAKEAVPVPPKDSSLHLFNGKDLTGWYTFLKDRGKNNDPKKVFTVLNGQIRISGEEWGCITTEQEYENYRLVVEFKWGVKTFEPRLNNARDCGILLHSQGEDGGSQGIWMHSIECQIIEGGTGDFIVVGDGTDRFQITCPVSSLHRHGNTPVFQTDGEMETVRKGRVNWAGRDPEWKDVINFRGANDLEKPLGKWNTLECLVKDGEITVFLNGNLVNKAFNVQPRKGKIQIQSEAAEIFFKRVDLIPLK